MTNRWLITTLAIATVLCACEGGKRPVDTVAREITNGSDTAYDTDVFDDTNDSGPEDKADNKEAQEGDEKAKFVQVFAKDIVVDCSAGKGQKWVFSANTLNTAGLEWKFSPDITEMGFNKTGGSKGVTISYDSSSGKCWELFKKGETVKVEACDAGDSTVCDSASFTVNAVIGNPPQTGPQTAAGVMFALTERPLSTAEKFIIHQANTAKKEKDAEIEADTCYVPDVTPAFESAAPGPQMMADGTAYTGYNFGDVVVFRVFKAKGLWTAKTESSAGEFTNDTWRIVEDPYSDELIIIGALIYRHAPASGKPQPMPDEPFKESLAVRFSPAKEGPCNGNKEQEQTLEFTVAPPSLATSRLTETRISVKLRSENIHDTHVWLEAPASFWLEFSGKNDKQIVTDDISFSEDFNDQYVKVSPKYLCQENGSPVTDMTNEEFWLGKINGTTARECKKDDTNIFLQDIELINIRYYYHEACGKKDWKVKLNYISIANDYVYLYIGKDSWDGDYETEVDGGNGCGNNVVESVGFNAADHPWQLRCEPSLPEKYINYMYKYKFKPPVVQTHACGEEIGD